MREMAAFAKAAVGIVVLVLLVPLDMALKALVGYLLVIIFWLPVWWFTDIGMRPVIWIGLAFSMFLWGLWDCSDMFGLNRIAEWAHRLIKAPAD
jgi:hypothetical protein